MATNGEISINWFTLRRRAPTLSKTFASSYAHLRHVRSKPLLGCPFDFIALFHSFRVTMCGSWWGGLMVVDSPKFAKSISLASSFLSFFYECNRCALVRRFIVWCFRRHTPRVNCIASITCVEWSGGGLLAVVIDCCLNVDVSKNASPETILLWLCTICPESIAIMGTVKYLHTHMPRAHFERS